MDADPRLYTTSIAMDDLDQVRETLGYPQINLYGASYGTRAAQVYARQHGDRVRTMILDGVVPLDWAIGPAVAGDAQRALEMLFDRCQAEPSCQAAFPDLPEEFQGVYDRLKSAAIQVKLDHPITGDPVEYTLTLETFANTVHTMSYAPESASLLPLMIHQAYEFEDYRPLAAQYLSTVSFLENGVSIGMRFSVLCAEDVPFYASEPASQGYLEGTFQEAFGAICDTWPEGNLPENFRQPLRSDIPTLLLSGEADPVTPPANGDQVAQNLTNQLHIVAPGQGHIAIFRGCIPQIASEFIEAASVNGLETECVQNLDPLPFFLNFSGPTP
jgi:pimeloyl-ACP methyl ester carboxylesterase